MVSATNLEDIERKAWVDMFKAAPSAFAAAAGVAFRDFAQGAAFAIKAAPTIQFNRLQLPELDSLSESDLDDVLSWAVTHCSNVWTVQSLEPASARLIGRGFQADGTWTKFQRSTIDPPTATTTISVRLAQCTEAQEFGRIVQLGFSAPPPFAVWAAALVGRDRWRTYLAFHNEIPIAAAALYLESEFGWLGLGCCLSDFRGLGAQSALLARRIADAGELGASTVVTETGTPKDGELALHPSFRNISRAGFRAAYKRTNYFMRQ